MTAELTPRILDLPAGSTHPRAVVQSLDLAAGVLVYAYADAAGNPVDSGKSIARFTPLPIEPEEEGGAVTYADPGDEILVAALAGPSAAEQLATSKAQLKARATERRWQVETRGITVGGVLVATDDRAKTLLTGADRRARRDPAYTTRWKGEDGTWADLTAATIIAIADAVFAHVDACFRREEELHAAISAASDLAALDALRPEIETFTLTA